MDPFVALMRRYVVDYTNRHDTSVCAEIMEPDYTLRMGAHVVSGRDDAYIPASRKQFAQFPGLGLTVHELVSNGDRLAMRFSEHGASRRHGGAMAIWTGLGLYRWNGRKLVDNYVEQDYLSRRRQLSGTGPDIAQPPALAPWDTVAIDADPTAERTVRCWIDGGLAGDRVAWDDGDTTALLTDPRSHVDDLFSAGDRVAFRLTQRGRYAGGLDQVAGAPVDTPSVLHLVGLVRVAGSRVNGGWIVRDRLGLAKALTERALAS
ncbi:MAG: ester cyclase [Sciscionella sp.]